MGKVAENGKIGTKGKNGNVGNVGNLGNVGNFILLGLLRHLVFAAGYSLA